MIVNCRDSRGIREVSYFGTGAGIVDLESSLNAVLIRMRPVENFSTASKAFAMERFADTGRLSAGSRMTTTRARDEGAAQSRI